MILTDPDIDIEEELDNDDVVHATAQCIFCEMNKGPLDGKIVETLCGKLIRYIKKPPNTPKCTRCKELIHNFRKCLTCGKVY